MISKYLPRQLDDTIKNETSKFWFPQLLGITNDDDIETLRNYSVNADGHVNATKTPFSFEYKHVYINRCYLLSTLRVIMLVLGIVFTAISTVWCIFTYYVWARTQYNVQKWLTVLPVTTALWQYQQALEYYTCPWDSDSALIYISIFAEQILSILTIICSSTVVNSIFYLIAIGWGTTMQQMEKNTITNVMIVGGSLYLLQLAKTYSQNDQSIFPVIFNLALASEYAVLLVLNYRNAGAQISKMQMMVRSEDLIPRAFIPGLDMKIRQMKAYRRVITIFYVSRIMYEAYYTIYVASQSSDEYQYLIMMCWRELIDLFNFNYLLWEFRPRKDWPEFFGLGVDQFLYRFEAGNRVGR